MQLHFNVVRIRIRAHQLPTCVFMPEDFASLTVFESILSITLIWHPIFWRPSRCQYTTTEVTGNITHTLAIKLRRCATASLTAHSYLNSLSWSFLMHPHLGLPNSNYSPVVFLVTVVVPQKLC